MAKKKDAEPRTDHQPQDVPKGRTAPGKNLEIETLESATAGTLTRTIRIKIDDADLNSPVD